MLVRSHHQLRNVAESVEKGETMEYTTPVVEVAGLARDLIQAYAGPRTDGDGYIYSQGLVCNPEE
jgi:hypothetical protein